MRKTFILKYDRKIRWSIFMVWIYFEMMLYVNLYFVNCSSISFVGTFKTSTMLKEMGGAHIKYTSYLMIDSLQCTLTIIENSWKDLSWKKVDKSVWPAQENIKQV